MSKQGSSSKARNQQSKPENYVELLRMDKTYFEWQGERYSLKAAPVAVFDAWIRQFVETIVNVDATAWDIFDRWGIVNAVLAGKFLVLSGNTLERPEKATAEQKASDEEQKASAPEPSSSAA